MEKAYDLVIRGGTVVDGTGQAAFEADVGVKDGVIASVGRIAGSGAEEIDARGQVVTPGFVDIHTHYDGQATWDQRMLRRHERPRLSLHRRGGCAGREPAQRLRRHRRVAGEGPEALGF